MKIIETADTLEVIETQPFMIVYSALVILCGFIAIILYLFVQQELLLFFIGILFIATGLFIAWIAETKTTLLNPDGTIEIKYERIIGHKTWIRKLNRSNIQKIDYLKSFDEASSFGIWHRRSSVYLNTSFNEQIEIGTRLGAKWSFNKLGIPIIKNNVPLDAEANDITTFLKVPLNIIDARGLTKGAKSIYIPKDKMQPVLQRPTQERLAREAEGTVGS